MSTAILSTICIGLSILHIYAYLYVSTCVIIYAWLRESLCSMYTSLFLNINSPPVFRRPRHHLEALHLPPTPPARPPARTAAPKWVLWGLLQEQRRGATMVQIAAIALGRPLMGFFSADISPESYWLLGFWAARAARALHAARQLALCLSRGF